MDPLRICAVEYLTHALTDQSTAPAHSPTLRGHAHVNLSFAVSSMAIGDSLRLVDLAPMEGVTYLDDPEETVLASVGLPTRVEEPEEVTEEGEELAEGEVPPEEQPEGAAEGAAEPAADAASGEQGEPGTTEG